MMTTFAQPVEACRLETGAALELENCRAEPVTPREKDRVRASLPESGTVTRFTQQELDKLTAVSWVLRFHQRDQVYDIRVIDVPQAWAGLHARAILLISLPALRILDKEQLAGIAAHETGHEYVWEEYQAAKARSDTARIRQLELVCDRIGGLTLQRLGISPDRLPAALERIYDHNRRFGTPLDQSSYPPIKARRAAAHQEQ